MRKFAFLLIALLPRLAWAWGDLGHAVVGEIADRHIKASTKTAIERILGPGPLSAAATWPDQVRFDKRYAKFAAYHIFEVAPDKSFGDLTPSELAEPSAYTVLKEFPKLLRMSYATEQARIHASQIALRYIIHVVGDIHQPLHTGNGIDQGGNLCRVELTDPFAGTRSTNLHTLWDEDILLYMKAVERARLVLEAERSARARNRATANPPPKRYYEAPDVAGILERGHPELRFPGALAALQTVDLGAWIQESVDLRKRESYPDALAPPFTTPPGEYPDKHRGYCGYNPASVVKLDEAYLISKISLVERQLLKAGYRLAALLDEIFSDSVEPERTPPPDDLIRLIRKEAEGAQYKP